ncbi:hypothetical protein KEM56_000148 [Ascosphaera pollenicola]|nr:hypothetical protein KEM56_000148 [Ascosphaera pollenicola]
MTLNSAFRVSKPRTGSAKSPIVLDHDAAVDPRTPKKQKMSTDPKAAETSPLVKAYQCEERLGPLRKKPPPSFTQKLVGAAKQNTTPSRNYLNSSVYALQSNPTRRTATKSMMQTRIAGFALTP